LQYPFTNFEKKKSAMDEMKKICDERLDLLLQALDLLHDLRPGMALFNKQRYYRFKALADAHTRLTEPQHIALAGIATAEDELA
jgi:hypothetical protein